MEGHNGNGRSFDHSKRGRPLGRLTDVEGHSGEGRSFDHSKRGRPFGR